MQAIRDTVLDHLVSADIIESIGGLKKAATIIRNSLPLSKISRSGDFGEIMATEFVEQATEYSVPVRRLRYKDDRSVAMRGDDVLGFQFDQVPPKVLKTESKSRANLTNAVVKEASDGLCRHQGRPNPSTLSFISRRLREMDQHDLAELIEELQESDIPLASISHLIFTLSGNDPANVLVSEAKSPIKAISRQLAGCLIPDHASFIAQVFDTLIGGSADGNG